MAGLEPEPDLVEPDPLDGEELELVVVVVVAGVGAGVELGAVVVAADVAAR